MARTRKMANLVIEETSGVDHPAHLHEGWLVMKSADESEVQRVLDETLTEEDSIMEETTTAATDAQVEKAEMTLEDAMKKIAELEGKLSEKEMAKEEEKSESDKTEDEMERLWGIRAIGARQHLMSLYVDDLKSAAEVFSKEGIRILRGSAAAGLIVTHPDDMHGIIIAWTDKAVGHLGS